MDYKKPKHFTWAFLMFITFPFIPGLNILFFGILWMIDIHRCGKYNKQYREESMVNSLEKCLKRLDDLAEKA